MAKYTETLAEFLDGGGTLPSSSFALITSDDFEDLFKERYAGSELGFETEALFELRLDSRARVVMPNYAARIAAIDAAILKLQTPTKVRSEQRGYGKQHSGTKNDGSNTELPYDAITAQPAQTTHAEGSADVDYHEDNFSYTEYVTIDENLRILETLGGQRTNILEACLNEFKDLFMGIY